MRSRRQPGRLWTLAAVAVAGLSLIPWGLTMLAPPPLVYRNVPFPVQAPDGPLHPGDEVTLLVERCVTGEAPLAYTFTRTLVPEGTGRPGIVLPSTGSLAPPGCLTVLSGLTALPERMLPGVYHIDAITTVTGWKTWQIPWQSAPFEVVPKAGP